MRPFLKCEHVYLCVSQLKNHLTIGKDVREKRKTPFIIQHKQLYIYQNQEQDNEAHYCHCNLSLY